ncbi:transcriptional regulator [Actinoplanes sp. NPDC023714]|uniref:transcriptional regulator n=1 Tax=Actinoplanes sp. NPDC023714 TaxID=3154322 RepID=UPI0033D5A7EA
MDTTTDLLVLHTLRCIGYAELPRVAHVAGLSESDTESELIDLAVGGWVTREFGGWGLTEKGHAEDARRIAGQLDVSGARATVTRAYERFLLLNPELLDLCSAWQMRGAQVNDHTDPDYDERVLRRFEDLDGRVDEVLAALPRFARYRTRLSEALTMVRNGQREHLADSLESYHSIWFQLHEDLLATLGIPR